MKYWTLLLCCAVLSGCDNKLANQAIKEAKVAFANQEYQEAMGLLQLASDEGESAQYQIWAKQGEAFLKMISFKDVSSLEELLLAWTDLNLIDTKPSFIKDEAVKYIREKLVEVKSLANQAMQSGEVQDVVQMIRRIEKRMGTLELFESEINELIELRKEMEGGK